jgi:TPR repeat protein
MYDNGRGVPPDYTEAVRWYRKSASQGNTRAQLNLGVKYAKGEGVHQDYVQAHLWFSLAASRSFSAADREIRDEAVENCDLVASMMTTSQIAEAHKLARDWRPSPQPRDEQPR